MKQICVFIDGSNFYHGIKHNIGKTNIDFNKLSLMLCTPQRELVRTYYYNAPVNREDDEEQYKSQQRFFDELKNYQTCNYDWEDWNIGMVG